MNGRNILTGAVVICGIWKFVRLCWTNYRLPPGPWGLPWIGYWPWLGHSPLDTLKKLHESHGDLYSFTALGNTVVLFNSYELIQHISSKHRQHVGRHTLTVNHWLAHGYGISNYDTQHALELRRALLRHLYGSVEMVAYLGENASSGVETGDLQRSINNEITQLLQTLDLTDENPVCAFRWLQLTVWRVAWRLVYGSPCKFPVEVIYRVLDEIGSNNQENSALQINQLLPKWTLKFTYLSGISRLAERYTDVCNVLRQGLEELDKDGCSQSVLLSLRQDSQLNITESELLRMAFEMMAAGTETSSMTLNAGLAHLSAFRTDGGERIDEKRLEQIHRLASIVPLGLPRRARVAMTIAGFRIPRDAILLFNLHTIHSKQLAREGNTENQPAVPFSIGSRSCPGAKFANRILRHILNAINDRFIVEAVDDVSASTMNHKQTGLINAGTRSLYRFRKRHTN